MSSTTALKTPQKGNNVTSRRNKNKKKRISMDKSTTKQQQKGIDLVTGKANVEYFFDPSLLLSKSGKENSKVGSNTPYRKPGGSKTDLTALTGIVGGDSNNNDHSKHLFMPCTIIKALDDNDASAAASGGGESSKKTSTEPYAGPTLVKTLDGSLHKVIDSTKLIPLQSDDYIGMDDVLHLPSVTEASLLHSLRLRYERNDIYTCAGPILMAINPYQSITDPGTGESLYSDANMMAYRGEQQQIMENSSSTTTTDTTTSTTKSVLPPHLFQVADRAFTALLQSAKSSVERTKNRVPPQIQNQSIIISGESGAGKTEATKIIMQYLARITQSSSPTNSTSSGGALLSPDGKVLAGLEERVLSSNPLLETFGNAQTLKNDNSSRFGKFIHIVFDLHKSKIRGAQISNYLLEKTRVIQQTDGERNYHIFYQLLAAAASSDNKDANQYWKLTQGDASSYKYLGSNSRIGEKDATDFVETQQCLARLGLTTEEQTKVLGVAAAVLHLGNLEFTNATTSEDDAEVSKLSDSSQETLDHACTLLGLDPAKVQEAILTKQLNVGGKIISKPQNVAQAEEKRDAFSKMTYSSLFLWLVQQVNETLTTTSSSNSNNNPMGFIGVLDIYGFEVFDTNGFEQLLINYCNEKLQRHFNRHLFEVEQDLYANEGVDWTYITFNDNRPCLELLEGGGGSGNSGNVVGIFNNLDDSWGGMGSTEEKDVKFVAQLHKAYGTVKGTNATGGHEYFSTPKFGMDQQFVVRHYAGEVKYTAEGFVSKNMDTLSNELKDLGRTSTLTLVNAIYGAGGNNNTSDNDTDTTATSTARSSIRGVSVGSQFRASLSSLMNDLERTQPHYIRCIKPNLYKRPNEIDNVQVLRQLKYSGMMEAIRIRREGYALREDHATFLSRFQILVLDHNSSDSNNMGIEQLVRVLSSRLTLGEADWQIGHSKIFVRYELATKLEALVALRLRAAARTVTQFGRQVAQQRAARVLVPWMKFRLSLVRQRRRIQSATKLVATYRRYRQVRLFQITIQHVVIIQTRIRQFLAKRRVAKIRDPYGDYTFSQMKELLASEQARLAGLVQDKLYTAAARLEPKIAILQAEVEKKRPMTRSLLEEQIAAIETKLEDAVSRKAYVECGPLQEELAVLVEKRKDLPTLEELQESIVQAEQSVADAIAAKDYTAAAAAEEVLQQAKQRLDDTMAAEQENTDDDDFLPNQEEEDDTNDDSKEAESSNNAFGIESRPQLEVQLAEFQNQLDTAIAQKQFTEASSLQNQIKELEALKEVFPSLADIQEQLSQKEEEQEQAIASKNFELAGELHKTVEELQALVEKLQLEEAEHAASKKNNDDTENDGDDEDDTTNKKEEEEEDGIVQVTLNDETLVFDSRADLDKACEKYTKQVSDLASLREFKKAEECQGWVDQLEALKVKLPSLEELQTSLKEYQKQMDDAIASKQFAQADEFHKKVDVLEQKVKLELSKLPSPPPPKKKTVPLATPTVASVMTPSVIARTSTTAAAPPSAYKTPYKTPLRASVAAASVASVPTSVVAATTSSVVGHNSSKPVSKLRPLRPILANANDNMVTVCKLLASKRTRAAMIPSSFHGEKKNGGIAGIISDSDVTRRVVARGLDPATIRLEDVMTPSPATVQITDSASDALCLMVEHQYRHLPVLSETGEICGLLDIGKCLNDAITKLETRESSSNNNNSVASGGDSASTTAALLLQQVVQQQQQSGGGGDQVNAAALQALLGPLMAGGDAGGSTTTSLKSPTLRSLLSSRPGTLVSPTDTVYQASIQMAEHKKAALVIDPQNNGRLMGLLSFKDIMSRVIAKELPLHSTTVQEVMTPNPDFLHPEATVLEALQLMHDHHFFTLPVCEKHNKKVVGLVDVMDVIYGCGGVDGWRSIFDSAMDGADGDDNSVVSEFSASAGYSKSTINKQLNSVEEQQQPIKDKPVSKLRPRKPLISSSQDSILSITQMLANKRGDASLIVGPNGGLAGIITDTDITRRVVAKHLAADSNTVDMVMTPSPTCVHMDDSAMDALSIMVENHFRHLPVTDDQGAVVGLLDIAKCLNDAIDKLERTKDKKGEDATLALMQATNGGGGGANAAALQAVLGPLMAQAFGNGTSPPLRSLLAGKPPTIVKPTDSVYQAAMLMAERRKAALVVDPYTSQLVGIFGFKDVMCRVVAKELDMDETQVQEVMTPNPEAVSPEMTVLEALQTMHDHKFLTLPVCNDTNGNIVGLVDVMDVIHGCGGAEGWRSIFSSVMEMDDDTASVHSRDSYRSRGGDRSVARSLMMKTASKKKEVRSVAKLRPKKPVLSHDNDTILSITQLLASKRSAASLVVSSQGGLAGIMTDTDVTRRVVAKHLDPERTSITDVMTANPTCVHVDDPAMDALAVMVESNFRHLPVIDAQGSVVGLLDIAKCLNDAIDKLERAKAKSSAAAEGVVHQLSSSNAGGAVGGNHHAAALQALLGPLMAQGTSPPLRTILEGKSSAIVSPTTSIREAGLLMAECRKAAVVVDDTTKQLVGIFGFKDMMTRAVAKELDLDATCVADVMTPNPQFVSPDMTVLDALQIMHDDKFLNLPVCEASSGVVFGLVNVMDVIQNCGGVEGWRSVFSSVMEMDDDSVSVASRDSGRTNWGNTSVTGSVKKSSSTRKDDRPVSKLRPKKPLLINKMETVFSCSRELAANRSSSAVIIDDTATLVGIITDTDITRRVAAKHLNPESTELSAVMTPNPTCVALADSAMDALTTMIENRYRHLPVVDGRGSIAGVLDIGKCLNDAITKLEHAEEHANTAANDALKNLVGSSSGAQAAALTALLGPLMAQASSGGASPTLRSVLTGKPQTLISPDDTVEYATERMADSRKAALIVDGHQNLVGILSFKDVCYRVIAKELPLASTLVSSVMTPEPEFLLPDQTVLEALQLMHDQKYHQLPVCEENGSVVGLVDVMDVIYGCGGAEGWRSIFDSAIDIDESVCSEQEDSVGPLAMVSASPRIARVIPDMLSPDNDDVPRNIIASPGPQHFGNDATDSHTMTSVDYSEQRGGGVVFKVADPSGHTHRIRCAPSRQKLLDTLLPKIGGDASSWIIKFLDDEGDEVLVTSDECLLEAAELAKSGSKNPIVKLTVSKPKDTENPLEDPMVLGAIGVGCVTVLIGLIVALRPRR